MSREKTLITLIEACEKPEFDKVVKTYLKEVMNYTTVILTDGKDDIGSDLKAFDFNGQTIQYQLTTQKSDSTSEKKQLEYKIKEDLEKAKVNMVEYGKSNSLYFFYSKTMTNKVMREYERLALSTYGITLTIIDANRLAQEAEDFLELQNFIYEINKLEDLIINKSIFPNEEKNLIFDLVGFGRTTEFKL